MVHHDLGQFVTDDEVLAWTLGLGYGLSYWVNAADLDQARHPPMAALAGSRAEIRLRALRRTSR